MRDRDDEISSDYDLSAWEVPPPSAGLAEAVIARVREPASAAAAVDASEKTTRRWWIAGGIAAVVAAAVAFALWGIQRAPKNGEGDVVAAVAQPLALGASSAQLDPGAQIHWRRDQHTVAVTQARGAASWSVSDDDTFVIDAGAMVASVEATGASLRVEVKMNLSDARVIGASAVTAAIVAMVTVIVYEGRVKVTQGGQTVTVAPGATLELHGPVPPTPDRITVGAGPDYAAQLADKDRQIKDLQRKLTMPPQDVADDTAIDKTVTTGTCDEVSCVLENYAGACCTKFKQAGKAAPPAPPPAPPAAPPCDFDAAMTKGQDHLQTGMDAAALAAFERAIQCKADPKATRLAAMSACRSKNVPKARQWLAKVPAAEATLITQICLRNGIVIDLQAVACDADALRQKGEDALQTGADALALRSFEASIACKPDGALERFAFMAACRSKNAASARRHYARLPAATTTGIVQICERNGILDLGGPQSGTLKLQTQPPARIFIDGVDSGKTTPASMMLPAGTHKVTFLLGTDKFTFGVAIERDKTVSLTKDLR